MQSLACEIRYSDLLASVCRESFYDFVIQHWEVLNRTPFIDNWHIKYLCDVFQAEAEKVFSGIPADYDVLVINVPPGSTKSTIFSIMGPAWIWTRMPSAGIIGASYTYSLAVDLSRKNRAVVRSEKYNALFPDIKIIDDQNSKGHFVTTVGGDRNSVGVRGDIIGRHGDFIIIDDPLNPKASRSDLDLAGADRFIQEELLNRKKSKSIFLVVLVMQRLCQNDTTGTFLKQAEDGEIKIKHICLPAEISDNVTPPELKKHYKSGVMDVIRLSPEILKKEKAKGEYYYAGQFEQSPVPAGGGMFKVDKFIIQDTAPTLNLFSKIVRYWDKAGTSQGGAFTVGVKLGMAKDKFWVLDVVRGQWDAAEREAIIKKVADEDGSFVIQALEMEPGSAGKESAQGTVRNLAGHRVVIDRPTGNKEWRADKFAGQVNAGNVCLVRAKWNADYLNELGFFPYSTYKDQVDASSGAFKVLNQTKRIGAW